MVCNTNLTHTHTAIGKQLSNLVVLYPPVLIDYTVYIVIRARCWYIENVSWVLTKLTA